MFVFLVAIICLGLAYAEDVQALNYLEEGKKSSVSEQLSGWSPRINPKRHKYNTDPVNWSKWEEGTKNMSLNNGHFSHMSRMFKMEQ